ncbi:26S proteasome non-ATPase regulatory subunit 10-like [Watersipora subatra]|uniref:26S proteasome non-ATPase regulatory subunit 10-like n=1 Tax=Watersipora subatra TaxID=2589382 RepID=UPI00355BE6BE
MRMDIAEAAKERQTELVRSMLTNNGELTDKMIESKDREYNGTALYWMSVNGELDIVRRLLERHADVNTCNIYKHTPLHAAADMGFLNILRLLLAHGARTDVLNENGQTPLHLAAYRGYYDVTECLIKAGADQTIQNARCLTPVQESIAMNHTHVAKLFCKDDSSAISLEGLHVLKRVSMCYKGSPCAIGGVHVL